MRTNSKLKTQNSKVFTPTPKLLVWGFIICFAFLCLIILPAFASEGGRLPHVKIDVNQEAIKRGEEIFKTVCNGCHGLKYLGFKAQMDAAVAKTAFGKEPPDLSLMAKARGKRKEGARYIYALLTSYNDTSEKNSVFPNTAMPPVLSKDDPQFEQKAKDVSAFLLYAAEPTALERRHLGKYVLAYMALLTILLYALNRRTWKGVKRKQAVNH